METHRRLAPALLLAALVAGAGCGSDSSPAAPDNNGGDTNGGQTTEQSVPDFALTDVNSTSTTYDTLVSPRDFLGEVSAWYFGHST